MQKKLPDSREKYEQVILQTHSKLVSTGLSSRNNFVYGFVEVKSFCVIAVYALNCEIIQALLRLRRAQVCF